MKSHEFDPISKPPAVVGPHGKAWTVDLEKALALHHVKPEDDACLVHWIVEAAWAHPLWHSYSIVLIHLRPLPDGRPTKFYLEGATHEIWVYAINPDSRREELIETGNPQWL